MNQVFSFDAVKINPDNSFTDKGTDYLAPLPADSFYLFFLDFFVFF